MFIQERGDELWLGTTLPRYWLTDGQEVGIRRAATYFGPMSMSVTSEVAHGRIHMHIDPPRRNPPKLIRARFRHPEGLPITRCELNGTPYDKFSPEDEWVEISKLDEPLDVTAYYDRTEYTK